MKTFFSGPIGPQWDPPFWTEMVGVLVIVVIALRVLWKSAPLRDVFTNSSLKKEKLALLVLPLIGITIGFYAYLNCQATGDCANMAPTWWFIFATVFVLELLISWWLSKKHKRY